jgi:hypothetical protein
VSERTSAIIVVPIKPVVPVSYSMRKVVHKNEVLSTGGFLSMHAINQAALLIRCCMRSICLACLPEVAGFNIWQQHIT